MPFASLLNSPKKNIWFLSVLLIAAAICLVFSPLVLSIDSLYGFLAYKGTLDAHSFNVIVTVSPLNINNIEKTFVSWWSPGQWIFPAVLSYSSGLKPGIACIIVTIICNCAGLAGYYRLFGCFKFSPLITSLSLLVIVCSSTYYYSYFIYQGGEVLEFAIFPWFCLYILQLKKISFFSLVIIILFFLLCFVAKSTLILYCTFTLLAKIIQLKITEGNPSKSTDTLQNSLLLLISIATSIALIHIYFLSKGNTPAADKLNQFNLRTMDILIPVSSPLHSLLSIQEWVSRFTKLIKINYKESFFTLYFDYLVYLTLSIFAILFCRYIHTSKTIDKSYKTSVFCIYTGVLVFFFLSYAFNARIGYDARHYKLSGYLFIPALIQMALNKLKPRHLNIIAITVILLTVSDFVYLKQKWTNNRYTGKNYFYRHYDNLTIKDSLDKVTYEKLMALDRRSENKSIDSTIFFVESDIDVALDIQHRSFLPIPGKDFLTSVYYGKGPEIVVCISKKTFNQQRNLLKTKFPDYTNFELTDETDNYLFFISKK